MHGSLQFNSLAKNWVLTIKMKKINLLVVLCGFMSVGSIGCMEGDNLSNLASERDLLIEQTEKSKEEENSIQRAVLNAAIEDGTINENMVSRVNKEFDRRTTCDTIVSNVFLNYNNNETIILTSFVPFSSISSIRLSAYAERIPCVKRVGIATVSPANVVAIATAIPVGLFD